MAEVKSISIRGFKCIKGSDPLELKDLKYVNYLIGRNGSGKSSIFEALKLISNPEYYKDPKDVTNPLQSYENQIGPLDRIFLNNFEAQIQLNKEGDFLQISHHLKENSHRLQITNNKTNKYGEPVKGPWELIKVSYYISNVNRTDPPARIIGAIDFKISMETTPGEIKEEEIEDFINKHSFFSTEVDNIGSASRGNKDVLIRLKDEGRTIINYKSLSSGQIGLLSIYYSLIQAIDRTEQGKPHIICVEEPEENLHPDFQKSIPELLHLLWEKADRDRKAIVFLVSTHSPFIISKSLEYPDHQKIYLLDNGNTIDKEGDSGAWKDGVPANNEAIYAVAKMIGSTPTDIGYPDNFCIVEENSLEKLLTTLKDKKILKQWQFIDASGNKRVKNVAEKIENLKNYDLILKTNIFYYDKYKIIIDQRTEENKKDEKFTKWVDGLKASNRLEELSELNIEDYYPDNFKSECIAVLKSVEGENYEKEEGKIKGDFALQVANFIIDSAQEYEGTKDPKEKFKTMFKGELDFLVSV